MGYLANAARLIIEFGFGAILGWLLLRLLTEFWRADFRNPICQFLYRSTHPVIRPLAGVLPSWHRVNLAVLVLAFVAGAIKWVLMCATLGFVPHWSGLALLSVAEIIDFIVMLYIVLVIGWALMSMLAVEASHPLVPLVRQLTEPLLRPIRRRLPTLGGIDFSPAVVVLGLLVVRALLLQPLFDLAQAHLR